MIPYIHPSSPDPSIKKFPKRDASVTRFAHLNDLIRQINSGVNAATGTDVFYVNGSVEVSGDGELFSPFKTPHEAVAAMVNDASKNYTVFVQPGQYLGPTLTLPSKANVNFIGFVANATAFIFDINYTPDPTANLNQYNEAIALVGNYNLDASLVGGGGMQFIQCAINMNRIDNNLNVVMYIVTSGVVGGTYGGRTVMNGGIAIGDIFVKPGSFLYMDNTLLVDPTKKIILTGNCTLKTLSTLDPEIDPLGYVNGIPDGSGTPAWFTDAPSDMPYLGTLVKTVY
jgi:hypothetical protein